MSLPRITERSIAASPITRRPVVEIVMAVSLARQGYVAHRPGGSCLLAREVLGNRRGGARVLVAVAEKVLSDAEDDDDCDYPRMIGCVGAQGDAVVVTVSAGSGQTGAAGGKS